MNIAILIGISEYENITQLPGSKNDIEKFDILIRETSKFENVLTISEKTESIELKNQIINFINSQKENEIEEVLFYFTGHGDFFNEDFYYVLSDFSIEKRKQSSLQNSELDSLIKSLNPKLVTKIVDACHSGVNYIKDINAIDTYIKSTGNQFKNCYFLYSSLNSQSSYQNKDYSFFTLSILNAIKKFPSDEVRYKDLIDYVSDEFIAFPEQTPFFVTQADFTERFCRKNNNLKNFLKTIPYTFEKKIDKKESEIKHKTLEQYIIEDAKNHITFDELKVIFENIKTTIEEFKFDEKLETLYSFKTEFHQHISDEINLSTIGQFVKQNKDFFAEPTYRTEEYETLEKPSGIFGYNALRGLTTPFMITKKREVLDGFNLTTNYPYSHISININAKYPNINSYNTSIFFISTDRKIRFYWCNGRYKKTSFTNRELNTRFDWNTGDFELNEIDNIILFIKNINIEINKVLDTDINSKFGVY
jgi:hypothetical protein